MSNEPKRLSLLQIGQLHIWMEKHKTDVPNMNAEALAEKASEELKFPISGATIAKLRRQMGLSPRVREKGEGAVSSAKLERILKLLASELVDTRKQLGMPIPIDLQRLEKGEF